MNFPWLYGGFTLGNGFSVHKALDTIEVNGVPISQLILCQEHDKYILLFDKMSCPSTVINAITKLTTANFSRVSYGRKAFLASCFVGEDRPFRLLEIGDRPRPIQYDEALDVTNALVKINHASWEKSIYIPKEKAFIPLGNEESEAEKRTILNVIFTNGRANSDGVASLKLSPTQLQSYNKWITVNEYTGLLSKLGLSERNIDPVNPVPPPAKFCINGQLDLQKKFQDHIIDYYHNLDEYLKMKISSPGGVILFGPPGSGKTYSVHLLSEFLGWGTPIKPRIGTIGSPLIHETSREINKVFSMAIQKAPCIVLLDELDAIGGNRNDVHNEHKVEEISELLTMIDEAQEKGVLVIGATNRFDAVDPALIRSGRLENHWEVGYLDKSSMLDIFEHFVEERPHEPGINLVEVATAMSGKSAGDAKLIVNEAGRIALRKKQGKKNTKITEDSIWEAIYLKFGKQRIQDAVHQNTFDISMNEREKKILEATWRSLVLIKGSSVSCSGIIIRPNIVATSCAVCHIDEIYVFKSQKGIVGMKSPHKATIRLKHENPDCILLDVDELWGIRPDIRSSGELVKGQEVYGIEIHEDFRLVSGKLSRILDVDGFRILQVEMEKPLFSSGGGLFDSNGNLIGILTEKSFGRKIEGVCFAYSTDLIQKI